MALAGVAASLAPAKPIILEWDYATNAVNTNIVFLLRGSTNAAAPLPWPVEAMALATNWYTGGSWTAPQTGTNYTFKVTQLVNPGAHFFYVTVSNAFWELESDPSNSIGLDALPSNASGMRARKGW